MDVWVGVDFSCRHDSQIWMLGNRRNLELVPLVESLLSLARVIDNSIPTCVVDDILLTTRMNRIVFDWLLLLEKVLIVSSKNSGKNHVEFLLCLGAKVHELSSYSC